MEANNSSLSVTLVVTQDLRMLLERNAGALSEVQGYVIDTADTAGMVASEMNSIKKRIANLRAKKLEFTEPAQKILVAANDLFNIPIAALTDAEVFCKRLLAGWDEKERLRVQQENQRIEAENRRIRQEAETRAAVERARADERARQAREEQAEQERRAQAARDAGDTRTAIAAEGAAAAAAVQAETVIEAGNAKAAEAELTAAVTIQQGSQAPAQAAALAGVQFKDNWVPRLKHGMTDEDAKHEIVVACAQEIGPSGLGTSPLLACLEIDMKTVRRLAKGLKGQMNVPGFEAVNARTVAGRNK